MSKYRRGRRVFDTDDPNYFGAIHPNHVFEIVKGRSMKKEGVFLTYEELKDHLFEMSEEELKQPVQIFPPTNSDDVVELHPVYCIKTLKELCSSGEIDGDEQIQETRGALDNKHHPEHSVLLSDHGPFSPEGDTMYTLEEDLSMTGDNTGFRVYDMSRVSLQLTEDKKTVEATYVKLLNKDEKSVKTKELIPSTLLVDYNKKGEIIGIEILKPFAFRMANEGNDGNSGSGQTVL